MKFIKLKDNNIEDAPEYLRSEHSITLNPSEEHYLAAGYKKYFETIPTAKKWFENDIEYIETDDAVIQKWVPIKVSRPLKSDLVTQKMREKYTAEKEIELLRNFTFDGESSENKEYEAYKKECDRWAESELEEYDSL